MSGLQDPKYQFVAGAVQNRASGELIPPDEPVFVFRARDIHAREALEAYACVIPPGDHRNAVEQRVADFARFAAKHPARMKQPDTEPAAGQSPEVTVGDVEAVAIIERVAGAYRPQAIHYEQQDVLEYISRDVPSIARNPTHPGVDILLDVTTREPIGWRIYGWSKVAPPTRQDGEGEESRDPDKLKADALAAVQAWADWCDYDETLWDAYSESAEGIAWAERRRKAAHQAVELLNTFGVSSAPSQPSVKI